MADSEEPRQVETLDQRTLLDRITEQRIATDEPLDRYAAERGEHE